MDAKEIEFTPVNGPNVVQNQIPMHEGVVVNMIDDDGKMLNLVLDVEQVTTPILYVKRYFLDNSIFPGCASDCVKCKEQPKGCDDLKVGIQFLMDEGSLQFDGRPRCQKFTEKDIAMISIPYTLVHIPTPSRAPL